MVLVSVFTSVLGSSLTSVLGSSFVPVRTLGPSEDVARRFEVLFHVLRVEQDGQEGEDRGVAVVAGHRQRHPT